MAAYLERHIVATNVAHRPTNRHGSVVQGEFLFKFELERESQACGGRIVRDVGYRLGILRFDVECPFLQQAMLGHIAPHTAVKVRTFPQTAHYREQHRAMASPEFRICLPEILAAGCRVAQAAKLGAEALCAYAYFSVAYCFHVYDFCK